MISFGEPHSLAFNTSFPSSGRAIGWKEISKLEQETCTNGSTGDNVEGFKLATLSTKKVRNLKQLNDQTSQPQRSNSKRSDRRVDMTGGTGK